MFYSWIRSAGVHTFRSTVDIQDSWQSIEEIVLSQLDKQYCSGPGCFNDMDILVVGMHGGGMNPETSMGGCTDIEYQTHFVLWAMMNSPLIIGCDVRSMSDRTREILTNPDVISIKIQEIEAAQLVRSLPDIDIAIINGNYAILGGLNVADALAVEAADSVAASTYANILAVREGDEKRPELQALYKALVSPELAKFMEKYKGAVLPSVK